MLTTTTNNNNNNNTPTTPTTATHQGLLFNVVKLIFIGHGIVN